MGWTIKRQPFEVKEKTVSGTTNAQGSLFLSGITKDDLVLYAGCTNNSNAMLIPWLYNNNAWYVKCVNWQNLGVLSSTEITAVVRYVPNGSIVS